MRCRPVFVAAFCLFLGLAALAQAEVIQKGNLRVNFAGRLIPRSLPRSGAAPVKVEVGARIATTDGSNPPQLRHISIEINRQGQLNAAGLPLCRLSEIQPATTATALSACRSSLVGTGSFSAKVLLPEQAPFPSSGRLFAFNGIYRGRPAILAHIYGTSPAPTSTTLPFTIGQTHGTFGITLTASLPNFTSNWGYVTGLSINLGRRFSSHGHVHSYLTASCPAPAGFPGAVFPFLKARFGFASRTVSETLTRSCGVRGG